MAAIAANPGNPFVATVDVARVAPAPSVLPAAAVVVSVSARTGTSEGVHGGFAVQSATLSLRRVAVDTYDYDAAGRMTSRTVDSVTTTLGWDVLSNLTSTSSTSTPADSRIFAYDASGQRVAQIVVNAVADDPVASKVTAYVGDLEVTDADVATTGVGLSATRFLTFGGATVATVTTGMPTPIWSLMLGDGQGSAQVAMQLVPEAPGTGLEPASASHTVTRNAYMPFGATRGTDQLATSRGWLGQVADTDTGLIYLNARYYDPVLARFVSPDPLMNPGDPKTLDPYRYADNNPVMMTDATGLAACAGTGANEGKCMDAYNKGMGYAPLKVGPQQLRPNVFAPFVGRWNPGKLTLPGPPPNPDDMAAWTAERDLVDANLNGSALRNMTVNGILNQWATSGNRFSYLPWVFPGGIPAVRPVLANDHRDANGGLAFKDGSYYSDLLRANRHLQSVVREGIFSSGPHQVGDSGTIYAPETTSLLGPAADAAYIAWPLGLESPYGAEAILGSYRVDYSILASESRSDGQWVQARVVVIDNMNLASASRDPRVSTDDQAKRIAPVSAAIPGYDDMPISAEFTEWFNVG